MDVLVVDLTHGGVKIAVELKKLNKFGNIYVYDIYNTLKTEEKNLLDSYSIDLLNTNDEVIRFLKKFISEKENLFFINPVHSSFNSFNSFNNNKNNINNINNNINNINNNINKNNHKKNNKNKNNNKDNLNIKEITHHEAVKMILKDWKKKTKTKNIPIIEVTGVKGKTSVVAMLKEILIEKNPLVLSSLGAYLYKDQKEFVLKKNISITPASILETVNLAKKNFDYNFPYDSCVFESSLGVTGLGDVGVLTNIVENYSIAKNTSNAKEAKEQVFNCDIVVIEKETLENYYPEKLGNSKNRINTFSLDDDKADLFVKNLNYELNSTYIDISYKNIKRISGDIIEGSIAINTFAPGKHHVSNVLATISAALSLGIDKKIIKKGLSIFNGLKGRTSIKTKENYVIIEEINPGINTKAIESSINMINNLNDYVVIIGGKYGITCEEIDENKVANLLDNFLDNLYINSNYNNKYNNHNHENTLSIINLDKKNEKNQFNKQFNLLLTDDVGKEIERRMKNSVKYIEDPFDAQKLAIKNKKNVLFIYRSNYSQINKR